ncbi:MAG: iron-sulfur cluster insertion protein ErpA [Pseudomonadota bacterium]
MTDSFVKRMKALQTQQNAPGLMLRIIVEGGGCQGFEYHFKEETAINDDDQVFEKGEVKLVIDEISIPFLEGSEVDYVDDLIGAHFKINNPNASSSCGCGTSFSV